jgi:3-oxoadipate enol-lactonase
MTRWFTGAYQRAEPGTIARFRTSMCRMRVPGYVGSCAALRDADLRDEARQVDAQCLVIASTHDVSTPPAAGEWLAKTIPGAELLVLDSAHLSNVERGAEFTAAVDRFFA